MRAEVFEASQLTCSAGIAPNKMLAKVGATYSSTAYSTMTMPPTVIEIVLFWLILRFVQTGISQMVSSSLPGTRGPS